MYIFLPLPPSVCVCVNIHKGTVFVKFYFHPYFCDALAWEGEGGGVN